VHGVDEVHGLLAGFDACVLLVPLTDATRGLVDARFLAAMPDGPCWSTRPAGRWSTPTR
jgi:phosphoglycerate dehydrogenase-like enzyme